MSQGPGALGRGPRPPIHCWRLAAGGLVHGRAGVDPDKASLEQGRSVARVIMPSLIWEVSQQQICWVSFSPPLVSEANWGWQGRCIQRPVINMPREQAAALSGYSGQFHSTGKASLWCGLLSHTKSDEIDFSLCSVKAL